MKQLFSKFLVAFLLTSAVVLSWSEYFFLGKSTLNAKKPSRTAVVVKLAQSYVTVRFPQCSPLLTVIFTPCLHSNKCNGCFPEFLSHNKMTLNFSAENV